MSCSTETLLAIINQLHAIVHNLNRYIYVYLKQPSTLKGPHSALLYCSEQCTITYVTWLGTPVSLLL